MVFLLPNITFQIPGTRHLVYDINQYEYVAGSKAKCHIVSKSTRVYITKDRNTS